MEVLYRCMCSPLEVVLRFNEPLEKGLRRRYAARPRKLDSVKVFEWASKAMWGV